MSAKRALVTGAAGFMGSHLVDALLAAGHSVFALDDLSGGYRENVAPEASFTPLDLRDAAAVESYIHRTKPEIIFHLAADATEGRSQFTPVACTQRNLLAYMHLLTSLIRTGFEKIVLTSSMSVYGAQSPPFTEDLDRKPDDIYGITKASMERATEVLHNVFHYRYTIVRPHNVYGIRQNLADPYRNVVAIFINALLQDKNYYIYGDGNQKRAFTYVDDFTPYLMKTGFDPSADSEIFNIGPDQEYSINELSRVVLRCFFPHGSAPERLQPKYLPSRPLEVREAYCSSAKARRLLGFQPRVSLEEGVAKMIEWARRRGPMKVRYLDELELVSDNAPRTWVEKLI